MTADRLVVRRLLGKVVAFVTRPHPSGPQLLVFDHPLAGVQLPAGTIEPGEAALAGATREAWEETGLDELAMVEMLGTEVESPLGDVRGRLAVAVEIDGVHLGRGLPAEALERRSDAVLVQVGDRRGWIPPDAFADDVVRHFFHFSARVETPEQ